MRYKKGWPMSDSAEEKYRQLIDYLRGFGPLGVALSGGADSSLLALAAKEALGENAVAITAVTPYTPEEDEKSATAFAKEHGIHHSAVRLPIPETIRDNPEDRCYLCKKILFSEMKRALTRKRIPEIVDGTNADDIKTDRPGLRAISELGVKTPLAKVGLTKKEIRLLLKSRGIPVWEKAASSCLMTRLPHNTEVLETQLNRVDKAEQYIKSLGVTKVRVRVCGNQARIEVTPEERSVFFDTGIMDKTVEHLKGSGFTTVSLDMEGYRTT